MEIDPQPRPSAWRGIAEAMAVFLACLGTIVLASAVELLVLAPRVFDVEFELISRDSALPAVPPADLVSRVEALGLSGAVEVRQRRGLAVLSLTGLPDADSVELPVNEILIDGGYQPVAARVRPTFDPQSMLLEYPVLTLGLQALLLIAFGAGFYRLRVQPSAARRSSRFPVALAVGLTAGLAGFGCALLISAVQYLLGWSIEEQAWLRDLLQDRDRLATLTPIVVLLVPLAEETFFRGYLFRFLLDRSGTTAAYLLSAGAFSLTHLHLPGLATYFVVGLLFAFACRRTATLTAAVTGHMTYNALALGFTLLTMGR